jgi:hypothetical protein
LCNDWNAEIMQQRSQSWALLLLVPGYQGFNYI